MLRDPYDFKLSCRISSSSYLMLCDIAEQCGLSVGCLVRIALEQFIHDINVEGLNVYYTDNTK